MPSIRTRFHPLHDIDDHEKLSFYSLDQTGIAGMLVKIATGSANAQASASDGYGATPVGASYNYTYSNRYETNWKVSPTASGDTRYNAVGLTMLSTLEYDENGFPLKYMPSRAKEIGAVVSGETVPVATKGLFAIWGNYIDQSLAPIQPGFLVVVSRSGNGQLASVNPSNTATFQTAATGGAPFAYGPQHVVGKWLSSLPTSSNTGLASDFSSQGGYAFLELNCTL